MKIRLSLIFICLAILCSGQTVLTNAQAYNLDIGDTIQVHSISWSPGPFGFSSDEYIMKVVTTKTYSLNNDTIYYTLQQHSSNGTINNCYLKITDLNLAAGFGNFPNCNEGIVDSIYTDFGNRTVNLRSTAKNICNANGSYICDTATAYIVDGVGGVYGNNYWGGGVAGNEYNLVYYSKVSGYVWGQFYSNITVAEEKQINSIDVRVFPNPSIDIVTIKSNEQFTSFEIVDLSGKKIREEKMQTKNIDVSFLNKGMYFLFLKTIDDKNAHLHFIKE